MILISTIRSLLEFSNVSVREDQPDPQATQNPSDLLEYDSNIRVYPVR